MHSVLPHTRFTVAKSHTHTTAHKRTHSHTARCESGCSCRPRYADATTDLPESTIYFVQLHASPHKNCTLVVINDSDGETRWGTRPIAACWYAACRHALPVCSYTGSTHKGG